MILHSALLVFIFISFSFTTSHFACMYFAEKSRPIFKVNLWLSFRCLSAQLCVWLNGVAEGRWNMIYGVSQQPNNAQRRRSFRSLLYAKVIPRSQRSANASRDDNAAHAQPTPTQDLRRPVTSLEFLARRKMGVLAMRTTKRAYRRSDLLQYCRNTVKFQVGMSWRIPRIDSLGNKEG